MNTEARGLCIVKFDQRFGVLGANAMWRGHRQHIGRQNMKSSLTLLLLLFQILFPGYWGCISYGQSIKLTAQEDSQLTRNWKVAYQIADYDRYSWIATDSLLKYNVVPNPSEIQGWIVTRVSEPTKVVFGRLD
jgi:hypothetical protein